MLVESHFHLWQSLFFLFQTSILCLRPNDAQGNRKSFAKMLFLASIITFFVGPSPGKVNDILRYLPVIIK